MLSVTILSFLAVTISAQTLDKPKPVNVGSRGTYMITFARKIRPGLPTKMRVDMIGATAPVILRVDLVNTTDKSVIASKTQTFAPGVPTDFSFEVPKILKPWVRWRSELAMNFNATGGLTFEDSTRVDFNSKTKSIFIQTDKAMYKPGEEVKFRVLATYSNLKVVREPMTIVVMDTNGNRLKQWLDVVNLETGVIQKSFGTSREPVLGEWKIEVTMGDQTETQAFELAEYVLPKFEANIEVSSLLSVNTTNIPVKVTAKYTFGQPVDGSVILRYRLSYYYGSWRSDAKNPFREIKLQMRNGEATTIVPTLDIRQLALEGDHMSTPTKTVADISLNYRSVVFEANVTEIQSGRVVSAEATRQFYRDAKKMNWMNFSPRIYKPGLIYTAYLKVSYQDDTLLPLDTKSRVNITVFYNVERPTTTTSSTTTTPTTTTTTRGPEFVTNKFKSNNTKRLDLIELPTLPDGPGFKRPPRFYPRYDRLNLKPQWYSIGKGGIIVLKVKIPKEANSISIEAKLEGSDVMAYRYVSRSYSPSDNFIQLSLKTPTRPKVGMSAEFELKSTEPVKRITYQIISKGKIIISKDVVTPTASNLMSLSIPIVAAMSPKADIVVFHEREDGEVVADSMSVSVEGTFDNQVRLSFNKDQVKPGEKVTLTVSADPDTVVYIKGVDKSVLLLKDGNDITEDKVLRELTSYDYGGYYPYFDIMRSWCWVIPSSGSDASSIFRKANLAVVTDSTIYRHRTNYRRGYLRYRMAFKRRRIAGQSLPPSDKKAVSGLHPVERIRKFFPETWLWNAVVVGPSGKHVEEKTAPDTITTWVATAFAMHEAKGLAVAPNAANLTTFRKLFVSLNLPYSVIQEEVVCLQALVFNYFPKNKMVLVTLRKNKDFLNVFKQRQYFWWTPELNSFSTEHTQFGYVDAGKSMSFYYCIYPRVTGQIRLTFTVQSWEGSGDGVQRDLLVEPRGTQRTNNIPVLVDLRNQRQFRKNVLVEFPQTFVKGSELVKINVAGDVIGPTLSNLDSLLRMPYGCGEQNMLNFAPNIYVIKYLRETGRETEKIWRKAENQLEKGYQQELKYMHRDGSFSAFGDKQTAWNKGKRNGSMWLTAFVTKCFVQAVDLIPTIIDSNVIGRSLKFMVDHQAKNGSFPEPGKVFNTRLQGGSGSGEALTAYVLIALNEAGSWLTDIKPNSVEQKHITKQKVTESATKATQYLEQQFSTLTDVYDIVIVTYALQQVNSKIYPVAKTKMESLAKESDGVKYWAKTKPTRTGRRRYWWYRDTDALNIEMTAYALLTYDIRDATAGIPIVRWIGNQRNDKGGFISTQDTVMALQGLTQFAQALYSRDQLNMTISVQNPTGRRTYNLNKNTALMLYSDDLPANINSPFTVNIEG
ncbi:ovostatin-like isoform X2 [Gigantopelta aegis]|uniref:ovostatin-like isoform X2 n=1 Tax=Gigantopelta aegis TaxID=1735272 RepID=UPI001B88E370|nr:ovostatin-like isoform X2 [Gigantopelta aegis]